jgi:hypothetical protein
MHACILSLLVEGCLFGLSRFHARNKSAVIVPVFCPWVRNRYSSRARLLAATSNSPKPPFPLGLRSVDCGTLKISPRHRYHDIAVCICRTHSSGGGKTCAMYHALAKSKMCTYSIL